ncbi:hypothetical protein SAMN06295912_11278 [Sphingomonas laterariae]|uniref:Uncharacterized protein n=1 Tax=Edaphosphingomonas laterariae TaxID=861865 RepID=A0A239GJG2_9SPHN|nr:hypothetical protein [Sphingomonas laterariae]SNS68633.1 hypothetical protein SAMN06295912_11278 [Sphingomonas laterariae]
MSTLSPLRSRLAGFENCYRIALQRRTMSGRDQFVVRTGNPIQPFRVTTRRPRTDENLALRVA